MEFFRKTDKRGLKFVFSDLAITSIVKFIAPPPRTQKKVLDRFGRFEFEGRAINLTMTVKVYLVSDNYQNK